MIDVDYCSGVEGDSIYINDYRIVGPKPWAGGRVTASFEVTVDDIKAALERVGNSDYGVNVDFMERGLAVGGVMTLGEASPLHKTIVVRESWLYNSLIVVYNDCHDA